MKANFQKAATTGLHQRNRKVETFQGRLEKQVQMWPGICLAIPCIRHSAQHKVDYDQTGGLSP